MPIIKSDLYNLLDNPKGLSISLLSILKTNTYRSLKNYLNDSTKELHGYKVIITVSKRHDSIFPKSQAEINLDYKVTQLDFYKPILDMDYLKLENLMVRILVGIYSYVLDGTSFKHFSYLVTDIKLYIYYKDIDI